MASEPTPRGPGRPPLPPDERLGHVLQLRLNEVQRNYVLYLAEQYELSMGEVVRRLIDRDIDSCAVDGMTVNGKPATMRDVFRLGKPDDSWLADELERRGRG